MVNGANFTHVTVDEALSQLNEAGFDLTSMKKIGIFRYGSFLNEQVVSLAQQLPNLKVVMSRLEFDQQALTYVLKNSRHDCKQRVQQLISSTPKIQDIKEAHRLPSNAIRRQLEFSGTQLSEFINLWHANLDKLLVLEAAAFGENPHALNKLFVGLNGKTKLAKLQTVLENLDRIIRVSEATSKQNLDTHPADAFSPSQLAQHLKTASPTFLKDLAILEAEMGISITPDKNTREASSTPSRDSENSSDDFAPNAAKRNGSSTIEDDQDWNVFFTTIFNNLPEADRRELLR